VFSPEVAGIEPSPAEQRVGRAARLFWLWFAANSSLVSVVFGGIIFSLGMSLRQAIVATLAGVALSFLPLGLGTLAGKRSGQPTMVVSRATFGVLGNILPAVVGLVSRLFWGAALLWLLGAGTASILIGATFSAGLSAEQLTFGCMAVGFVLAVVIAYFGYALIARIQLVLSIVSAIAIIGFIALTSQYIDVSTALTTGDGDWTLVVTGAVLVFSFVGLVWANSSSDLARYQRAGTSGGGSMLWATFGAALPSFLLIAYGALLAASNPQIATGLATSPLDSLGRLLPVWYPVPLVLATALSLLSGVVISIYSGGFALLAAGVRVRRPLSVMLVGVVLLVIAAALAISITGMGDFTELFRDFATTLAVPVAAWAGIFAAEVMIRNRRYHTGSLLRTGGVYPTVRWGNLIALVVVTVVGLGLTSASVGWLGWQGYLLAVLGIPATSTLAATDLGVLVALVLGLFWPIVAGIPAVRRQESTAPPAE
jgi:purine-cytosine permease-like protein